MEMGCVQKNDMKKITMTTMASKESKRNRPILKFEKWKLFRVVHWHTVACDWIDRSQNI